jgi:glycosyltransferase involved in cell wall biosynthesis
MKTIDVVIPTINGREHSLERLLESLRKHTTNHLTEIVVGDSKTCGWGWAQGLAAVRSDYVLLACDDQQFISYGWDVVAIAAVDQGKIPCPRVWMPDGRIESQGGDMRLYGHVVPFPQKDWAPVQYTTVPFLSAKMAEEIGMLADCHYATDVWVSGRGKQLGYETALRHGYDVVHWREMVGRGAGMRQSDRDAHDVATMLRELERYEEVVA